MLAHLKRFSPRLMQEVDKSFLDNLGMQEGHILFELSNTLPSSPIILFDIKFLDWIAPSLIETACQLRLQSFNLKANLASQSTLNAGTCWVLKMLDSNLWRRRTEESRRLAIQIYFTFSNATILI